MLQKKIFCPIILLLAFFVSSALGLNHTLPPTPENIAQLSAANSALVLIILGLLFLILEAHVFSFGIIGGVGLIAFFAGALMLFNLQNPNNYFALVLLMLAGILALAFFFLVIKLGLAAHHKKIVTGEEALIGMHGTVISVENQQIKIHLSGEIWNAEANIPVKPGDKVKVIKVKGLMLFIELAKTST